MPHYAKFKRINMIAQLLKLKKFLSAKNIFIMNMKNHFRIYNGLKYLTTTILLAELLFVISNNCS